MFKLFVSKKRHDEILNSYIERIDLYRLSNNELKEQIKELNKIIGKDNKNIESLIEANQKMSKWIYTILKEFGTCDVREKHVTIPIMKTISNYDGGFDYMCMREERIEIPSITLIKHG